jgi:hypothetical protein
MWKNLHDASMLLLHLMSTCLLILQAILTVRVSFFLGLGDAILEIPQILPMRRAEKKAARIKDRDIRKLFLEFKKKKYVILS